MVKKIYAPTYFYLLSIYTHFNIKDVSCKQFSLKLIHVKK